MKKENAAQQEITNGSSSTKELKPVTKKPSRTGLKVWVFRLAAILLPVAGLELCARTYFFVFVHDNIPDQFRTDTEIPYTFPANSNFLCADTPTQTNNLGIRDDDDIDLKTSHTEIRIVCIGDSVTFGYCVSGNANSYPAILEKILRSRGHLCQVLNGGMPRFRIQHVGRFFAQHLAKTRPDIVVVLGGWNNANDQILIQRKNPLAEWVKQNWYTFRMIKSFGWVPKMAASKHHPADISNEGIELFNSSLRKLRQQVLREGAQPLFCTLPHFFHSLDDEESKKKALQFPPPGTVDQMIDAVDQMNMQLRSVASKTYPAIELETVNQPGQFGDAIHPNDVGSKLIAEIIADYLIKNKLLSR